MDRVISKSCHKGTILQRNFRKITIPIIFLKNCCNSILQRDYRKMTIAWSFSYHSFVKFHGEKNGRQNKTMSYPNRERSGSVIECLTRDRRAAGSSLTSITKLWSLSKTHLS